MVRPVLGLLLLTALSALACSAPEDEAAAPLQPDSESTAHPAGTVETTEALPPVPDLTLPTIQGDSLRLTDLKGRVVLLNFWATWCAPCRTEIPDLNRLHEELSTEGVTVVGVALDEGGLEAVRPFAEEFGIRYPVVLDDGTLADQLGGVYALPTTFVVDPEGNVTRRVLGVFPVERMRLEIIDLAKGVSAGA